MGLKVMYDKRTDNTFGCLGHALFTYDFISLSLKPTTSGGSTLSSKLWTQVIAG